MERRLTVEFGPSRSKRFAKAVAAAQSGPGECQELEPGRYRVSFLLGSDAAVYVGLAPYHPRRDMDRDAARGGAPGVRSTHRYASQAAPASRAV